MSGGPEPIPESEIRVERFLENADVHAFDCGNKDLNDFLTTEEVGKFEREKLGKTHLVYWQPQGRLLGYFTISSESLRIEYFRSLKSFSIPGEIHVSAIPGIKIGRLAVDSTFKRRGVGGHILRYIAGLALQTPAAVRVLFLEAYPESVAFYDAFDFDTIEHQKLRNRRNKMMCFDLTSHPEWME
jgi:GNAT superfamily N-acetyltransferase